VSQAADAVGPVLEQSELGWAVLRAIQTLNHDVQVLDRGSYLRVHASRRCVVTRQAIEAALGRPIQLPGDLELAMPSFRGRLMIDADRAVWEVQTP
jgi:toluene monooxygenase system protein D